MINPSKAENMAIVAVGGYGRGGLAPGPISIFCFCCPTSRPPGASKLSNTCSTMLWDMGLKVGHSTRNIDECIRFSARRHDDPHGNSRCAISHRQSRAPSKRLLPVFDEEIVKDTGPEFIQAKLAERDQRHRKAGETWAIWLSRTSRKARAASATCIRCSGSPNIFTVSKRKKSWSSPAFCHEPS